MFLGSSIGNFHPAQLTAFLRRAGRQGLLLGFDLKKDPARLHAAYNDAAGWSEEFSKNILVRIGRERRFIHLVGEDRKGTVIECANNDKRNPGWIQRSVLGVEGDDFLLENLTVHNTTPYRGSQAEAVAINAERCVLRNADFLSFQDTLHLAGRVFVSQCYIEGDVDYVWGYGMAVFDRCELKTMHDGYLVQARNDSARSGFVFLDCRLTAAPGVKKCWLARIETTRFPASHVAYIRCAMGPHIPPAGWEITGGGGEQLRFQEFASTTLEGVPLDVSKRHAASRQLSADQGAALSPEKVLGGADGWKPAAVPSLQTAP